MLVRWEGAATIAIAETTNPRREYDRLMLILLLCWFTENRGTTRQNRFWMMQTQGTQRMRPMLDKMGNAFTTSSNCRSESRLKMRSPNHAPSKAAAYVFHFALELGHFLTRPALPVCSDSVAKLLKCRAATVPPKEEACVRFSSRSREEKQLQAEPDQDNCNNSDNVMCAHNGPPVANALNAGASGIRDANPLLLLFWVPR